MTPIFRPTPNLQQFFVEQYLVERIAAVDIIDLRWKSRVVGVSPHDDHVSLQISTPEGTYEIEDRMAGRVRRRQQLHP